LDLLSFVNYTRGVKWIAVALVLLAIAVVASGFVIAGSHHSSKPKCDPFASWCN
jgi:hypothetical protein